MDHAARGARALGDGDALTAVSAYTQALIEHPSSPDYFVQRSTALTRLRAPQEPQHELSLADAEYAVLLAQKRARREKIQAAQQRRVIALFGLRQYGDAAFVLGTMERWRTKEKKDKMEGDMWKAKIQQRLDELAEGDPARDVTVEEYPGRDLPSEAAVKKLLQAQLNADGTFKLPGEVEDGDEMTTLQTRTAIVSGGAAKPSEGVPADGIKVDQETIISTTVKPQSSPSDIGSTPSIIRYEWFQNAQNITITFYSKAVSKDQAEIEIKENSVHVSFPHPSRPSSLFTFILDPLFAPVDAAASKFSVLSTKVEVVLRKAVPSQKWTALEGSQQANANVGDVDGSNVKTGNPNTVTTSTTENPGSTGPAYPTSSRSGPKNWDKVADDLTAKKGKDKKKAKKKQTDKDGAEADDGAAQDGSKSEEGGEDDNDNDNDADSDFGGDPVDGFFKKLYAGADPDTRRAMMKSYQESGGTALSTDWGDVGKRKVVPVESKND